MTFNKRKVLKLLHWNANGISNHSHLKQLEYLLEREEIHIASLNDTYFNESHKTYFKNYIFYRRDREGSRGGGVALIVRKTLKHTVLDITTTYAIENISIEILVNQRPIVITTAYSPRYTSHFTEDIMKLTSRNKEFIILGDLNAKHISWNCSSNNTAGTNLFNLLQSHNFFLHSTIDPTYYPHQHNRNPSVIDVVLSNTTLILRLDVLGYEIPSDHRPIVCSINNANPNVVDCTYLDFKNTNWTLFQSIINSKINITSESYRTTNVIDNEITKLINVILEARDITTHKITTSTNNVIPTDIV